MYANVVVLTYQPPEIDSYTYEIPKNLNVKPGQLVSVPFGARNPMGIILSIADRPSAIVKNIKPITSIVVEQPILLPYQLELLAWMSAYYLAPMVNCLETLLPPIPKKQPTVNSRQFTEKSVNRQPRAINQTLVLVPSLNRVPETLAKYPKAKNHALYHGELKTSEKFLAWQKIASGNCDFIFGSRSAIFTPCPKLKSIIIYDEHDGAYKDERSPYYDTLTVAQKICELTGARLKIFDNSPKVSTYFLHRAEIQKHGPVSMPATKIVSLIDEKLAGNKTPISQTLENLLKKAQAKRVNSLLFLNKKSESGGVYCRSCKYSGKEIKEPQKCPSCGSGEIWFNSLNIYTLAKLVEKIIPNAKVNLITEDNRQSAIDNRQSTVDIATAGVFYKLSTQKYALVTHVAADTIFNVSDYTSGEKAYAQVSTLKNMARQVFLVQSYNPQNPILEAAVKGDSKSFYQYSLNEREAFSYPPFSLLIKMQLRDKKDEEAYQKAKAASVFLKEKNLKDVIVVGPYKAFGQQTKYNIAVKIRLKEPSLKERFEVVKKVSPVLKELKDAQLVVEPSSLN